MKIEFSLATIEDDASLRRLIASNPVPGGMISLLYKREPAFFDSVPIMGKQSDVIIGRHDGSIMAMGMASYMDCYINGQIKEIGYLSSLRIDKTMRSTTCLFRGYKFLKKLDAKKNIPFYLSTIIEDNHAAIKVLGSHRMSIPRYVDIGRYTTYAIMLNKHKRAASNSAITRVKTENELERIVDFINSEGAKKQFYPVYTKRDMTSFIRFDYRNLWVFRKNDEILGVVGVWDQSGFKQTTVHRYDWKLNLLKPFYNLSTQFTGYKKLPEYGEKFEYLFLTFVAVKANRLNIFSALLDHIHGQYADNRYHYMIIGLHENDPLKEALVKFRTIKYHSRMYVVSYKPFNMRVMHQTPVPYLECSRI